MMEKTIDRNGLDRVCLISADDLKMRSGDTGFDPLHPVFYRTEGAEPFAYANAFCQMKLGDSGSVTVTRIGTPEHFASAWSQMIDTISGWSALKDIRIYDFSYQAPPAAVGLTTYGRVMLHGNTSEFEAARSWIGVRQIYWDVDGFGGLSEDDIFHAVGSLSDFDGTDEVEEVACSALPGHCSPVAYVLQKSGTVLLFDRKNHSVTKPRERVQQIALVKYYPYGVSTWVALSKITGRFLCSEPRDSISADFFGGDYTDIIAPNRYRQKIRAIAAVPRKYLAVLYENGYLRVFGAGYNSGDILCEDVQDMELENDELIVYLPSDLSYAPAIEFDESGDDIANAECNIALGAPVDLQRVWESLRDRITAWQETERNASHSALPRILRIWRNQYYIYFLFEDGTVRAELLASTGHSDFGENKVEDWHNVAEILPGRFQTLALCRDGSVLSAGKGYGKAYDFSAWRNVTALCQSSGLAAGLCRDGTVFAQQADTCLPVPGVAEWRGIVQIEAGEDFLVGLTSEGTVKVAFCGEMREFEAGKWRGIRRIAVVEQTIAGLTAEGRVLSAGTSLYVRFHGMDDWRDIRELVGFQNGGSAFFGLCADGSVAVSGRWNTSAFSYEDTLDHKKWSSLAHISSDGYYLLGEKLDGTRIYESTPTEKAGDPPMDEHISDWGEVKDFIIAGEYLLAIFRDGTVAWEGARRRAKKRRITDSWRDIIRCLLWNIEGGKSNALAVDGTGHLYSDMVASGFDAPEHQKEIDTFFQQFVDVREIYLFEPFLLVLHGNMLSFVLFSDDKMSRIDLPDVESVMMADQNETAVVTFTDGSLRTFGNIVFHSGIDLTSTVVKYYGDRSDYSEEDKDRDPFRHFDGILGIQPDGRPFVLSPANTREKESYYTVQDLLYFDTIEDAADIEPMGDILLADGSCVSKRGDLFNKWVGIRQLSSCFTHAVGVTTFNTVVVKGDGEYGSCSVDAYMGVVQAYSLPHATVLLLSNGKLISLCEKLSETPYEPLPVETDVVSLAKTNGHFVILCKDGSLWDCEAQAFADKIRWRGSSEYYTRPWGPWKLICKDAYRVTCIGESISVWRHDKNFSYMEPTLEQNTLSGYEPTMG